MIRRSEIFTKTSWRNKMGFAIIGCFATIKEAENYVDELINNGYDKNRLFIFDDTKYPDLIEKDNPYTVNIE